MSASGIQLLSLTAFAASSGVTEAAAAAAANTSAVAVFDVFPVVLDDKS